MSKLTALHSASLEAPLAVAAILAVKWDTLRAIALLLVWADHLPCEEEVVVEVSVADMLVAMAVCRITVPRLATSVEVLTTTPAIARLKP